ncbi:LamG domain-containing protein, partial [Candidatus Pacearchaeota archaeon]|nr:LamG domain-containing protein [Candidatus Pacearchaeota archaeon]
MKILHYSDGTWTHVALVQDAVSPVLYVNGVAPAQTFTESTNKTRWFSGASELKVGRIGDEFFAQEQQFYNGSIDEVLIFDRALSAGEIKSLYNNTANRLENNFTSLSDGIYNYSAYAIDEAGNLNWTSPDRQYTVDTTFPAIVFANPTTNSSNLSQSFIQANLSFSDTNLGTANISLFNSTQNIINSTAGTTSTLFINFTGLSDGRYYLNATINDSANNKNYTETRNIYLDTVPPNVTINSPTATTYTVNSLLFNATAIDLTTFVDSCWYTLNSGTTNQTLSRAGTSSSYNFTQTSIADSVYTARFYCNDTANNVNNTENAAFTIDTSVPAALGGGPAPVAGAGVGGGAGASKPSVKRIFNLNYNMYDQTISLKQVEFDLLKITNNGEISDDYIIEVETIGNIISFENNKLSLEPGETKGAEFKISSPKEPGIYTGKIIVTNGISEREVLVTINVKTEKSLFDITLTIPES